MRNNLFLYGNANHPLILQMLKNEMIILIKVTVNGSKWLFMSSHLMLCIYLGGAVHSKKFAEKISYRFFVGSELAYVPFKTYA